MVLPSLNKIECAFPGFILNDSTRQPKGHIIIRYSGMWINFVKILTVI